MGAPGDENLGTGEVLAKILEFSTWWSGIEEPKRKGCVTSIVESKAFETLCMCVILFNSGFVAYIADWEMKRNTANDGSGTETPGAHTILELTFNGFFLFELVLKIICHRGYFFVNQDM